MSNEIEHYHFYIKSPPSPGKEVVMCNKNLRLNSPLKVNSHYSLLKHCNFDFALFQGGVGVTLI